jgi:hypothetical protein
MNASTVGSGSVWISTFEPIFALIQERSPINAAMLDVRNDSPNQVTWLPMRRPIRSKKRMTNMADK